MAIDVRLDRETHEPSKAHEYSIAVLIPCFNEGLTIGTVVTQFRRVLPQAKIYVYDNNSTDNTVEAAKAAGAIVRHESAQGKGNVVRRMFGDIDSDLYLMVDGDGTYDANSAIRMLSLLEEGPYDMVNAARRHTEDIAYRPGHVFGNWVLTHLVSVLFGSKTTDMLSGYKAFSRRFVKSFQATSRSFEIETELMIHCLDLRLPTAEIIAPYYARIDGSTSKLSTFRDGFRILRLIGWLVKQEKPFLFFTSLSVLLAAVSLGLSVPIVENYYETGLVPRLPTAVLSASIMIVAVMCFFSGLILDSVTQSRREAKRFFYLLQKTVKFGGTGGE